MPPSDFLHNLYINLGGLAIAFLLLNVILCLYKFKQLPLPIRRFCYFLIWNLIIEITARSLAYSGVNNLPFLHLYTLGEFILLGAFYKSLVIKPATFQNWFSYLMASGIVLIVINSLFFQNIYGFNTIAKTGVQLTVISFAVLYFYNLTENQTASAQTEKGLRLINSAVLIYYSGSLFIFMCSQISFEESALYEFFWAFNAALYLSFQLLVLWGIWKMVFPRATSST